MSFGKQQTIESIRSNLEIRQAIWDATTNAQRIANAGEYRAEKVRKCKIRMINAWREKQK